MWGTETAEGKVAATVGVAGECTASETEMTCYFVGVSFPFGGGKCTVVASTWTEHFKRVLQTKEEVRWSATKGPTGLSGILTSTVLTAKRNNFANSGTDFFNDPAYGPGPHDQWSYHSTQIFAAPTRFAGGKQLPPATTSLSAGAPRPEQICKPADVLLMATSPD